MNARGSGLNGDLLVAGALALALGTAWTLRDWAALTRLRLPDTDDAMRLQQVRDWLAGQAFADVAQHRLGLGQPMHWSRFADLAPAALIQLMTPVAGRHAAEAATVIVWPLALFAAALALVARVARAVAGAGAARTAAVVAAVAYPATTIFAPGRIDHHGLQIVLLLGAVLATLAPATWRAGAVVGVLAAASLTVGLETAPLLAVLGMVAVVEWVQRGEGKRLLGLAAGALAGLIVARAVFATEGWDYPACDGFDAQAWRAATVLAVAPLVLGAIGSRLASVPRRGTAAVVIGVAVGAAALSVSPPCVSPYGAVDPELVRVWLSKVGEAQPLFVVPAATALGYGGVMLAGLMATAWAFAREWTRGWAMLLAVQLAAAAITCTQLRGAYAGAMLAAPALACVITAARARGVLALAGAWLGSSGMLYPLAAQAMTTVPPLASRDDACTAPETIERLARLPPGVLLAPVDTGAWAIAATPHHLLAGPYHRNAAGTLAALHFYAATPDEARVIAVRWHVRYVLACDPADGRFARALLSGPPPRWLHPLSPDGSGVHVFAVAPRP